MSKSISVSTNNECNQTIEVLEEYARDAANSLKKYLSNSTINHYKKFLNIMYHYTMGSEEQLKKSAKYCNNEEIKKYFLHMAKEERGHYILAQEDLRELGEKVTEEVPKVVVDFNKLWDSLSENSSFGCLGANYVFENVAKHLQNEGIQILDNLNLSKKQRRWVIVHLEADLEHGEEAKEMCEKYSGEGSQEMIEGGEIMYKSWANLFIEAFR